MTRILSRLFIACGFLALIGPLIVLGLVALADTPGVLAALGR